MPIPHFRTLYVAMDRVKLDNRDDLSIGELGRLYLTPGEITRIKLQEKREKKMAFGLVDKTTLPVTEFGRHATEPKVGVAGNGRMVFNKLINDAWNEKKVNRLVIQFDPDSNRILFIGIPEGSKLKNIPDDKMFPVSKAKSDSGLSIAASSFLKNVAKYDYSAAGNQSFVAEFDEKLKGYVVALPTTTPAPRPVKARTKKADKAVAATVTGSTVKASEVKVEAPADDELVIE